MTRDYQLEIDKRVGFIRRVLEQSGQQGIVFGNSGGKDSALVGALSKLACDNTVGVMMPCGSAQNYGSDLDDAIALAETYGIENRTVDLTATKEALVGALGSATELSELAASNIAPRLRMATVYAIAAAEGRLVAGCSNRTEYHIGYFTKWGDGGYDFNPIFDLTVREVYEFLAFLKAPASILSKAPSAGLFEGQTDEADLGLSYERIDRYLLEGIADEATRERVDHLHRVTAHKRRTPPRYGV